MYLKNIYTNNLESLEKNNKTSNINSKEFIDNFSLKVNLIKY